LHLAAGRSLDADIIGGRTHRLPASTPMISATDASTRVMCPAVGSLDSGHDAGHIEMYSPPGPNFTAGSIRPILCVVILDTSTFRGVLTAVLPVFLLSAAPLEKPKQKPNKSAPRRDLFAQTPRPNCPPP